MFPLNDCELYAIARAAAGLSWQDVPTGPVLRLMLMNLQPKDATSLLRLLGPELSTRVLTIDPSAPAPANPYRSVEAEPIFVPALPSEAQLDDVALQAAEMVGGWLKEILAWSTRRSPMTPPDFLTAGLVWTLGLAIARRCAVSLHKPIFPHLYVLWVAPTSLFKKTTGMDAIIDLVQAAMPHMLLPEENTPESFIGALGGKRPTNYDALSEYEKRLEDAGRTFAAQRGMLIDEASSLFGASKKDYMQGHTEMLMRLYDAPQRYTRNVRSEGKVVVYEASLCILGATTPVSLLRNISAQSWETGELARYVLLYPEHEMPYLTSVNGTDYKPPANLVKRLATLHTTLPMPPDPTSRLPEDQTAMQEPIVVYMTPEAHSAYNAYTKAVTYDLLRGTHTPDSRLHPNYARLHIQAAKVALSLAVMDWSEQGAAGAPQIQLGHWAQAQQIAETWRAAAHHLLDALNRGEDSRAEARIHDLLLSAADGLTLRDLTRKTGLRRKSIEDALRSLQEAGVIYAARQRRGERGPETILYRADP